MLRPVKKKILIAEDEKRTAHALDGRLRARGYQCVIAQTASEIIEAFDENRPDLLILSLTLPGDAGRDICEKIRDRPLGALVPILLLGREAGQVSSVQDAIAMGADHFFLKPDQLGDLLTKVGTYIGPGLKTTEGVGAEIEPSKEPPPPSNEWTALDELLRPADHPDERTRFESAVSDDTIDGHESLVDALMEPGGLPKQDTPMGVNPIPRESDDTPIAASALAPHSSDAQASHSLITGRPVGLAEHGIAPFLIQIERTGMTGRLEVASNGVLRRLFFESGQVVYGDSSAPTEDLASHLAQEGLVARTALAEARLRAENSDTTPEEVLIETGVVAPEAVYDALKKYVFNRVYALFALEVGDAMVVRGGPRPMDLVGLEQPMSRIVLDGIRLKVGRLRLYRLFGTATVVPARTPSTRLAAELGLKAEENAVLAGCDGRRSAQEIARAIGLGEIDTLAVMYGLSVVGLVEATPSQHTGLAPLNTPVTTRALAPQTADRLPGYAELVHAKHAEAQTMDYFHVLGVPKGATQAEIKMAYDDLRKKFDPHRVSRESPLWKYTQEIASVLDDAYRLLANPRRRSRYESAIT